MGNLFSDVGNRLSNNRIDGICVIGGIVGIAEIAGVAGIVICRICGIADIAGISGIVSRLIPPVSGQMGMGLAFVIGLLLAAPLFHLATGSAPIQTVSSNLPLLAVAGLLVGFGSVFGNGCTSGHGVCGLSRVSLRSLVATATFMATAFVTVYILRHIVGA